MIKLDDAIKHFKVRANESMTDTVIDDCIHIVDALEEIRDLLIVDKQPAPTEEQPATFLPWHDIVEIVGSVEPTEHYHCDVVGFEGIVTDTTTGESGKELYKVQISDLDDWFYFPASSLKLMYRLRPRTQQPQPKLPEPPVNSIEETLARIHAETVFKPGEKVRTPSGDIGTIEMICPNNPEKWWVDYDLLCGKALYKASDLERFKPAPGR